MTGARICISVMETEVKDLKRRMAAAAEEGDLVEIRLDALRDIRLDAILPYGRRPLIVTNRRKDQGGLFEGSEDDRVSHLRAALRYGVAYVDAEWRTPEPLKAELMGAGGGTRVILSHHILDHTPPPAQLVRLFRDMSRMKPAMVKIVTHAERVEDTLVLFQFLSRVKDAPTPVIAHCMGPLGRVSRVLAPLFGSAMVYAAPAGGRSAAPGQMGATRLRQIWEALDAGP